MGAEPPDGVWPKAERPLLGSRRAEAGIHLDTGVVSL
jgi:hypothetical protein